MPDLELLAILRDVLKAFPQLSRRNCVIYLNHSNLIATLIESCLTNSSMALKKKTDKRDMRDALIKFMVSPIFPIPFKLWPSSHSVVFGCDTPNSFK